MKNVDLGSLPATLGGNWCLKSASQMSRSSAVSDEKARVGALCSVRAEEQPMHARTKSNKAEQVFIAPNK